MRKLFIFGILSTFFLINPCFGADFDQGEVSCSAFGVALKDIDNHNNMGLLPGFAIGYYLTDSIKVTAEHATIIFASETLASLYYYHKIKNTNITQYIRAGVGVDSGMSSSSFVYQVSFGVSVPLFSDSNIFVGYRPMFSSLFKGDRDMIHALEFGIDSRWSWPFRDNTTVEGIPDYNSKRKTGN